MDNSYNDTSTINQNIQQQFNMSLEHNKTKLDIGICVYNSMKVLIYKDTKLPFTDTFSISTTEDYKYFELYEGQFKDVKKNILTHKFTIPKDKISGNVTIHIDNDYLLTIKSDNYTSETIKLSDDILVNKHLIEHKNYNTEKIKIEEKLLEYTEYIYETKKVLFDKNIVKNVPKEKYNYIVEQFNMAEKICFVTDITIEEIETIQNEVETFVNNFFISLKYK